MPVAADARRVGLDDAERERHGDGGIDDVAAPLEQRAPRPATRADGRRRRPPSRTLIGRLDQRLLGDHRVDHRFHGRLVARLGRLRPVLRAQRSHSAADGPSA